MWWFLGTAYGFTTQTDTVGGVGQTATGDASFKLDVYGMGPGSVRLDLFEVFVRPLTDARELTFVVYQQDPGGSWVLVWDSGPVAVTAGAGYKESPPVGLVLEGHAVYAIGFYLGEAEFEYGFEDVGDQNIGWALVNDVVWSNSGTVPALPDPIEQANGGTHRYQQRITVAIPDDADGDGADELTDCDDADGTRFPGAPEACNALDDDCDGAVDEDLGATLYADADGDGFGDLASPVTACDSPEDAVADATDCDDGDAAVHPGADEACDGADSDCDGAPGPGEGDSDSDGAPDCADPAPDDPTIGGAQEALVAAGNCRCDAAGTPAGGTLALLGAWVGARRYRMRARSGPSTVSGT